MLKTKGICAALGVFFLLALLVPVSEAQFKVTDNFNRPDGAAGLGWSSWGNGAQISANQLETFGEYDVAGGIQRTLDVTFPLSFSFDFSTTTPSDGGWGISFNAANTVWSLGSETAELRLLEYSGSQGVCTEFQTSSGPSFQCSNTVSGQRNFTATAHISGTVYSDFSAKITIKYNDGMKPNTVTIKTTAPVGALQNPLGSIFFLGNSNASYGPHFLDNFSLTLR